MKKLILLILVLCTLTSCAKKNEEFEIRNGIKFGMSKEEVIAIEGEPSSKDEYRKEINYEHDFIKGIDSYTVFRFNQMDELAALLYLMPPCVDEEYTVIDNELVQKYGQPIFDNTWDEHYSDGSSSVEKHERIWYICQLEDTLITISHLEMKFLNSQNGVSHQVAYKYEETSYKEAIEKAKQDKL